MKTVLDFLGQLWLRFLKPNGPITIPHQTEGKAKRFSDNNSILQKSLGTFLQEIIEFRFNLLSEETEYRYKRSEADRFYPVTQRDLNSICMEARRTGIDCRDRDVNRFVYSKEVKEYHPFRQYMEWLPEWDGKDRVSDLARRVSSEPLWVEGFHRWMLALASQWMGSNRMHANSLAPILVSERQGCQKSTFCKSLMPSSLVRYYTDSVDLSASTQMEQKLGLFGLINLDEFDRLPDRKMALLKNWMQMAGMNVRKAHAKHFHPLPRLASFIGTTNQKNLLSAPTGSRRFLCVEVQSKINCEGIEHDQIYAQLKNELQKGERHWFTSAEEEAIMRSNEAFYKRPIEEDVFHACFRAACPGDLNVHPLSAASIFQILKEKNPAAMRSSTASNFGKVLTALHIERKHTRYGNLYQVVPLTLHTFHRI
mgnify:FL=1